MPRQAFFMCAGHGAPTLVRTSDNCEAKADREVTRGVEVPPETLVVGTPSRTETAWLSEPVHAELSVHNLIGQRIRVLRAQPIGRR